MFELKHLKTLVTLNKTGNIKKAADALFTSQSALSHQIKDLEQRINSPLFIRNSAPLVFTEKGQLLLNLANKVLPEIESVNRQLNYQSPEKPSLKISIACHACFQWLIPLTEQLNAASHQFAIEFIDHPFIANEQQKADIVFTDEKVPTKGYIYQEIGEFEVVAVVSKRHELTAKQFLQPQDFATETLLTYPIKIEELDAFKLFLNKSSYQPKQVKQVKSSHIILQMVAADMGIATMPDWLVQTETQQSLLQSIRLTDKGIFKTLYARYHQDALLSPEIKIFLPLAITAFKNLYE